MGGWASQQRRRRGGGWKLPHVYRAFAAEIRRLAKDRNADLAFVHDLRVCLLCDQVIGAGGAHPGTFGSFLPREPEKWGAQLGRGRLFVFTVCAVCKPLHDSPAGNAPIEAACQRWATSQLGACGAVQ